MNLQPIGFTPDALERFQVWYRQITGKTLSDAQAQAYFDASIDGVRLYIEISSSETLSGNPVLYVCAIDDIAFANHTD